MKTCRQCDICDQFLCIFNCNQKIKQNISQISFNQRSKKTDKIYIRQFLYNIKTIQNNIQQYSQQTNNNNKKRQKQRISMKSFSSEKQIHSLKNHPQNKEIKNLTNNPPSKKTNTHDLSQQKSHIKTNQILANRLLEKLKMFDDCENVSLVSSIPILHAGNLVQVIKSVEEVQELLNQTWKNHEVRMRNQAKFIYHLWQLINQEQISTLKLKQIIYLFHLKKGDQLKIILGEMFGASANLEKLYQVWKQLNADNIYYRQWSNKRSQSSLNSTTKLHLKSDKSDKQDSIIHKSQQKFHKAIIPSLNSTHKRALKPFNKNSRKQLNNTLTQFTISKQKQKKRKASLNKQNIDIRNKNKNKKKRIYTQYSETNNENISQSQEQLKSRNHSYERTFTKLYDKEFYNSKQKIKQQEQKRRKIKQLQQCTFKPTLCKYKGNNSNYNSKGSQSFQMKVKGYDKIVNRLQDGYKKQLERKKRMNYINVGENYDKIKEKGSNPPKFLQRTAIKNKDDYLFSIGFEISNRKTVLKIREKDTSSTAATKICQIYGLNLSKFHRQIEQIIQVQMNNYYNGHI